MKSFARRLVAFALVLTLSCTALCLPGTRLSQVGAASLNVSANALRGQSSSNEMTVSEGSTVTVSISIQNDDGYAYQWYYLKSGDSDWKAWVGHTTASTSGTADSTWHGMQLYCHVETPDGATLNSNALTVWIAEAGDFRITSDPQDKTVELGQQLTLSVGATGENLTYKWFYRKKGTSAWSVWSGHTNASETFAPTADLDGGQFYCRVTNGTGHTLCSAPATITVTQYNQTFAITSNPQSQSVVLGKKATLSVTATGSNLSYEWRYKKVGFKSWCVWKNRTKATETVTPDSSWDGIQMFCRVTDGSGATLDSDIAVINVTQPANPLTITSQPQSQNVVLGKKVTLSVTATGDNLTYEWRYKKVGFKSWSVWKNRTKATESVTPDSSWDGIQMFCRITDGSGATVDSDIAVINVTQPANPLTITSQPQNQTIAPGQRVTLSVTASGDNLTYEWRYKKVGFKSWCVWKNRTRATESVTPDSSWNGIQMFCRITDGYGVTLDSDTVTIWISGLNPRVDTVGVNAATHSQADIRAYISSLNIDASANVTYQTQPVTSGSFNPGKLSSSSQNNALNILNSIRYIAGIPYNVTLDDTYGTYCQAGALVNYVNNELTHYPTQPSGMSDELYNLGSTGCSHSNIAWASWSVGFHYMLINQWLDDSDNYNLPALGHRRWLLNPSMGKTGFGMVKGSNGTYGQIYAFDRSNSSSVTTVVWPAQQTPLEYFPSRSAWSISSTSGPSDNVTVKLERVRNSEVSTWTMNYTGGTSSGDGYININNQGYGMKYCVIFRPNDTDYQAGDYYNVYLYVDGTLTKSYCVDFFSLG